jgi:Ras-related protein Rab-5C
MIKTLHYKVVFFGESAVGKTSIVTRFVRDDFLELQEPTIGAAFHTKSIHLDDYDVKMEFWDTAGQERYMSFAPLYYRGAKAAFIVYDITDTDSLLKAKYWMNELSKHGEPGCILTLLGNKSDLPNRRVEYEEVALFAKDNNIIFSEVSAKTGANIDNIMTNIAQELALKMPSPDITPEQFILKNRTNNKRTIYGCC